ncbi:MAG: hypothetical protein WDM78_20515 [Puia sp.]
MYSEPARGIVQIWTYLSISTTHLVFKKDSLTGRESYFDGDKKSGMPALLIFHVHFQNDSVAWLSTAQGLIELNPKPVSIIYTTI